MSQSHFTEDRSHFYLRGKDDIKSIKTKPEKSKSKQQPFFAQTSKSKKGALSEKAEIVKTQSIAKKTIFDDRRLYFVITFSDSLSWKPIKETLESLQGKITHVYGDKTVKIAIPMNEYNSFTRVLEKGRRYIKDISESTGSDKIDDQLASMLERNASSPHNVTIEIVDLSGLGNVFELESSLKEFANRQGGEIKLGYKSEKFAVFTAILFPHTLREIAERIELVEHVHFLPPVSLSSMGGIPGGIGLASIISMSNSKPKELPTVCTIDSGINRDHMLVRNYIADTHDFSLSPNNDCKDNDGHGTMVSGIIVYGGSCNTHTEPLARVIMSKGFEKHDKPLGDILTIIQKTVEKFSSRTKVFNFSFAMDGPNASLTKVLEDMAYSQDISFVVCSGNIPIPIIKDDLENNRTYPDYLQRHHIFFPGDCRNALTVGSFASSDSTICRRHSPSPFTRAGISNEDIKPDLLEDGGNINARWNGNQIDDFSHNGIGIKSASFRNNSELLENVGTSFSCPSVAALTASILERYPDATQPLIKAIILSSCTPLVISKDMKFSPLIQGLGRPNCYSAMNSTRWRTCYLIQGSFDRTIARAYRRYRFLFPDNADRLTITIVCSRPADSKSYIKYKLIKSGAKITSTSPKPRESYGSHKGSTYQGVYDVKRGGKGLWAMDIIPFFDHTLESDSRIKYGCIIAIESSNYKDVYSQIASWMSSQVEQPAIAQVIPTS